MMKAEDQEGVAAIRWLQQFNGKDESEELALTNWKKMPDSDREITLMMYRKLSKMSHRRSEVLKEHPMPLKDYGLARMHAINQLPV